MKLQALLRARPFIHATLCVQVLLLALTVAWAVAAWAADVDPATGELQVSPDPEELAMSLEGKATFHRYCRNCHGEDGKGDGPVAEYLRVKPADLTTLSAANDGEFPIDKVEAAVDGRDAVRTHGSQDMPIWGDALRAVDAGPEEEARVRQKIRELAYYLKSIQVTAQP